MVTTNDILPPTQNCEIAMNEVKAWAVFIEKSSIFIRMRMNGLTSDSFMKKYAK